MPRLVTVSGRITGIMAYGRPGPGQRHWHRRRLSRLARRFKLALDRHGWPGTADLSPSLPPVRARICVGPDVTRRAQSARQPHIWILQVGTLRSMQFEMRRQAVEAQLKLYNSIMI